VVEADLTCQIALLHHLVLVDASAVVTQPARAEQRDFRRCCGTAPLRPRAGRNAWAALSSPDPRALESLDLSGLPRRWDPRCGA